MAKTTTPNSTHSPQREPPTQPLQSDQRPTTIATTHNKIETQEPQLNQTNPPPQPDMREREREREMK